MLPKKCLLFTALFFSQVLVAGYDQVVSIESYHDSRVQQLFQQADEKTLVVFDVDDTLIYSPNAIVNIWSRCFRDEFMPFFLQHLPKIYDPAVWAQAQGLIFSQCQRELVQPEVVEMIQKLQAKGVKVVALTAIESGGLGQIFDMPQWRAQMLNDFEIQLDAVIPDQPLEGLVGCDGAPPRFYQGVIATNWVDKGPVLKAFFDQLAEQPSKVIYFDDNAKWGAQVFECCSERGIECSSFCYTAALQRPGHIFKPELVLKQLQSVVCQQKWISEAEAELDS